MGIYGYRLKSYGLKVKGYGGLSCPIIILVDTRINKLPVVFVFHFLLNPHQYVSGSEEGKEKEFKQ